MKWLAAAAVLALLAPLAQAHASPDPLDVEVHVLADDSHDDYAFYDGFDIQDVYLREGSFDIGNGIVLRVFLYGGFAPAPVASELSVELDIAGQTVVLTTTDGTTFQSTHPIVESEMEASDDGPAVQGYVQVLVPYEILGELGDSVEGFAARSYADGDLRDIAPGGRPVPGTNGQVVEDHPSARKIDNYTLAGPLGYTTSAWAKDGDELVVKIQNRITVIGQHIQIDPVDLNGWVLDGLDTEGRPFEPGVHPEFRATPTVGVGPLTILVRSDLGGAEELVIAPHEWETGTPAPAPTIGPDVEEPTADSPLPLAVLLAALLVSARHKAKD